MIYFVTKIKHDIVSNNILIVENFDILKSSFSKDEPLGIDFETTGYDAYKKQPLLLAIGNKDCQVVIDCTSFPKKGSEGISTILKELFNKDRLIIGQNLKFDLKFMQVHYGLMPHKIYDTMIVDQKLYQNCPYNFGLNDIALRHLNIDISKEVRSDFSKMLADTARFSDRHILYNAGDIKYLFDIKDKQMKLADAIHLTKWLEKYECKLTRVLAKCELTGFYLDVDKIRNNVSETEKKLKETISNLDNEFKKLKEEKSDSSISTGRKYSRVRNQEDNVIVNLFGEQEIIKPKKVNKDLYINWNSNDEVLKVLAILNEPAPLTGEAGRKYGYLVPLVENGKVIKSKGVLNGEIVLIPCFDLKNEGWALDTTNLGKYIIDNPNSRLGRFWELLLSYRKLEHELSTFGTSLIDKINPITGRIHTVFRQMAAVNGRLQSGGGKAGEADKINFQNIPRDKKFRTAFRGGYYNDGIPYSVVTCDLTGAEVTIMCDKADDRQLYEWAVVQDDSHSPMVTAIWKYIFLYRAGLAEGIWSNYYEFTKHVNTSATNVKLAMSTNSKTIHWLDQYSKFIVNKKTNLPFRQAGKNGTFGGVYGMRAKKAQETYNNTDKELAKVGIKERVNVTLDEGNVALYAQRKTIPKTFAMVEENARKGLSQGFLILNDVSYSRIWFYDIIMLHNDIKKKYGRDCQIIYKGNGVYQVVGTDEEFSIDWKTASDYDGQCRNVPISGTQADIVKMAMVEIDDFIEKHELDCKLLSQIHDEVVYSCPKDMDGKSEEFNTNPCKIGGEIFNFANFVQSTMIKCANIFLKNVKMKATVEVADTWVK